MNLLWKLTGVLNLFYLDDGRTKPEPRTGAVSEPEEYSCIFHAKLKSKKISTVVRSSSFLLFLSNLLKEFIIL